MLRILFGMIIGIALCAKIINQSKESKEFLRKQLDMRDSVMAIQKPIFDSIMKDSAYSANFKALFEQCSNLNKKR